VARQEATQTSDIDLSLYAHDARGEGPRDAACWRDGVYVEVGLVTPEGLDTLQYVMENPIKATHIRDAMILYDPTGFFAKLQVEVREAYMEHRWLKKRRAWTVETYRIHLLKLREAIRRSDVFVISESVQYLSNMAASVPL
jgi:hypothetical protein